MDEAKLEEAKLDAEKEDKVGDENCSPQPPRILLSVDLHCVGCAKKIEKSILKVRGVEEVEVDMVQNQVTVRGTVEPQALCSKIQKKSLRSATVISPLVSSQGDSKTDVAPQVSEMATVELLVNMHCVACAQQLRKKILKLRGVQMAEANLSAGKMTVTGTMRGESVVEYIHRCTGKIATIVPQAPNVEKEKKKEAENAEEKPAGENEEKKEDSATGKKEEQEAAPEEKKEDDGIKGDGNETKQEIEDQKKEEENEIEEEKKEEKGEEDKNNNNANENSEQEMMKRTMYNWNGGFSEEVMNRRMIHWTPVYYEVQQPPPPPQIFSDENPNACCII